MAIGLPVGWRSRRGVRHLPRRPQLQVRRAMLTTTRKPATVGEILVEEFMQPLSLTQGALAEAMGVQRKHVNELCNGRRSVTAPTALILARVRSEEHTSELQSLMRISYAVFCLKKKTMKQEN